MNMTEMIARVREDLQDTDQANYRWSDAQIEWAIWQAVSQYSLHAPLEQQTDLNTTDGSRELDISTLTGLVTVTSVEFPIGAQPPRLQRLDRYAGRVYMEDQGNGQPARVRWTTTHTITSDSSTIPLEHDEIIVLGATGYLAQSASVSVVDRAFIAGRFGTQGYRIWGRDRTRLFERRLREISRTASLRPGRLYTDE